MTLAQVTAMAEMPNTEAVEEEVAVEPLILTTPMKRNRVVLVFLARVAAVEAVLERAVLVKI